jgi:hypothetical protein
MGDTRKAESANYWKTTVHPAKSQADIMVMLEDFGSTNMMITQGRADEKTAWLIRFEWRGQSYRFVFIPLECEHPERVTNFGGKRRRHPEQARYQMGRIAVHFVKAILTAAEAQPHALFGFLELPEAGVHPGGVPMTTGELDVSGLARALPAWTVEPFLLLEG